MLMKHVVSAAALAVSIALALSGCGDKSPAKADPAAEAATGQLDAQQSLTVKLNDYIDCYNSMDANLHRGIALYTDWIKDVKAGPTGRESQGYGPAVVDDFRLKKCDESIAPRAGRRAEAARTGWRRQGLSRAVACDGPAGQRGA
jgi:predicted small lipoprotein YifL